MYIKKSRLTQLSDESLIFSLYDRLYSNKTIYGLGIVAGIIFMIGMWQRYIHIDENWFGEQAFYLVEDGVVKIKSLSGILNFQERMFVYHKLFVILGAAMIKMFGWSVYTLKSFTLILFIIYFYFLYKYYLDNKDKLAYQHFLIAFILIFANPITMVFGFTYRPEIMVMTLGFISYFFLERYVHLKNIKWVIFAGIFSGLAFFAHLTGMLFPIAGFSFLLFQRKYKALIWFFCITTLVSLLYSYDLWDSGHFEAMIYEFKNYPILQFGKRQLNSGVLGFFEARLFSVLNEHKRYLWSYYVFTLSIMFWIGYFLSFKVLIQKYKGLFIYCTALIVGMAILSSYKAQHYLIYFYPYMTLIVAIAIIEAVTKRRKFVTLVFILGLGLQVFYLFYEFKKVLTKNGDHVRHHQEILAMVPDNQQKILVPWDYIFNEIDNYPLINAESIRFYQMDQGYHLSQQEFFEKVSTMNIGYIVFDTSFYFADISWKFGNALEPNPYYEKIAAKGNVFILKRKIE